MVDLVCKRINSSVVIALVIKLFTTVLCFALVSPLVNLQTVVVDADVSPEEGGVLVVDEEAGAVVLLASSLLLLILPLLVRLGVVTTPILVDRMGMG
jgi:hypothetical protein